MTFGTKLHKHSIWQSGPSNLIGSDALPDFHGALTGWFRSGTAWSAPALLDYGAARPVLYAPDGGAGSAARAASPGLSAGGGGAGGGAAASSSLVINISWDASVQSAPSGFTAAVLAAAHTLESQFVDPVTINLSIGYGEVNGRALGSDTLGASQSYLDRFSYPTLRNALAADATSADDRAAAASLPAASPVAGTYWTTTAQAKALGLAAANGPATDGFIGFSSSAPFAYDGSNGVAAGSYDFNGVALHEMTEVMGRLLLTGATIGGMPNSYDLLDLFHYASPGVHNVSATSPGYFSVDGGTTSLGAFNTVSGGDAGDWASAAGNNSFDAFTRSGVINPVTGNDLRAIDVLGWNRGPASPSGVAVAPAAGAAATAAAGNAAIATVTQLGGSAGDRYTYALGGAGAGAFTLTTANNIGTLALGAGGSVGAINGRLHRLAVTATDTTRGTSAAASPLDVVVASDTADTVNVAALSASLGTATPTLVCGLAGADRIDARGMSGRLWLTGGAGADTMIGGSGANHYLYAATSDSTATAMDVIANFNPSMDVIDLTGLGQPLNDAGQIRYGTLGAGSVGWQASGGDTFVYVNTSGGSEALTGTDMKMELLGSVKLGSSNFALA